MQGVTGTGETIVHMDARRTATCVSACPEGTYETNSISLSAPYLITEQSAVDLRSSQLYTLSDIKYCAMCPLGCKTCTSPTSCTSCKSNAEMDATSVQLMNNDWRATGLPVYAPSLGIRDLVLEEGRCIDKYEHFCE